MTTFNKRIEFLESMQSKIKKKEIKVKPKYQELVAKQRSNILSLHHNDARCTKP